MERVMMDRVLKPFMIKMAIRVDGMFKENVIPTQPQSKMLADIFDTIIKYRQGVGDERMVKCYRGGRNMILHIYENDSHYSDDVEKALLGLSKHIALIKQYEGRGG